MLKKHPSGVCIHGAHTFFAKKKKGTAHGVLTTDYKDGVFYGVNPSHQSKRYGYTRKNGKGIESLKKMNMSEDLMRYTRISYLENLNYLHDAYGSLGLNGTGEELYRRCVEKPIK